jgi:Glycosyltransferase family 28 C-terminal domain
MLWCEIARSDTRGIEHLAVFVSQLDALGVRAGIDLRAVPPGASRNTRFDIAPYLFDAPIKPEDQVALIAADQLTDARLVDLRRLVEEEPRRCVAFGRFSSRQAMIGIKAKLSYVFGCDPRVINLAEGGTASFDFGGDCPAFGVPRQGTPREGGTTRPRLLVADPPLADGHQAAALMALALSRRIELAVLTDGEAKRQWLASRGTEISFYSYGEILPVDLCERIDILACFAPLSTNYRLQCLAANLAVSGVALLDCTPDHAAAKAADAFIRAPADLLALASFVADDVAPNLGELGTQVKTSSLAQRLDGSRVAGMIGAGADDRAPPERSPDLARRLGPAPSGKAKVVFMPTNGVGLGHAQRCTLVAAELDRARIDPVFAAFPSCTGLVKAYGFDAMPLVQRSALHTRSYENDLVNYVRLKALTAGARTLVFDGGYVFDSVYRTIIENRLPGVWLRRGLWQAGQDNTVALDRGKVFSRVIVPTEAFTELNDERSHGERVHRVGPIVQRPALDAAGREGLRRDLAERYAVGFDRLVVTQLGGGVAADRGAQIQALCGMMERRPEVLHLVLVWPTAALQPGWFAWSRTRVVKTRHAGILAAAADLCISAAGYNSFHEILYGALPAILIPQTGAFMDDQTARARAARDRDLVGLVAPHELMALDRAVVRYLDEGEGAAARRRLAALDLPEPGNRRAAALIEELADGHAALERPPVADRSAGRR